MAFSTLYVTCSSLHEAKTLAGQLLEHKLVACANILPGITSLYEWDGELCDEEECIMFLKTRKSLVSSTATYLSENHSYDCPCIVEIPISSGHQPFLDWIKTQTRD